MTGDNGQDRAFTPKQGQYLSFIYYYIKLNRVAPAEADFVRYFGVSAPTVHQMIVKLQSAGLISRTPGQGRSIQLRVPREQLPDLD
jgi:Mn-dependent DtxR family transcriptional regulator